MIPLYSSNFLMFNNCPSVSLNLPTTAGDNTFITYYHKKLSTGKVHGNNCHTVATGKQSGKGGQWCPGSSRTDL